jgi:tRNA threonylcarbamoyl adenosine modification protein (Sua5/YciO/YrdC/YwlC family)
VRPLTVDPDAVRPADLTRAVAWLRGDRIVALPTDTFYGLAVDPRSLEAVAALFALKGRAATEALPLIASSRAQVEAACGPLSEGTRRLSDAFWPGPLALVVDVPSGLAPAVHAGTGTVAVRVPAHAVARALAEAFGDLVTATSANRSGEPPASTAASLGALAADARLLVIDGGPAPGGAASTIVDARGAAPRLVRAGAIAWDRVLESWRG